MGNEVSRVYDGASPPRPCDRRAPKSEESAPSTTTRPTQNEPKSTVGSQRLVPDITPATRRPHTAQNSDQGSAISHPSPQTPPRRLHQYSPRECGSRLKEVTNIDSIPSDFGNRRIRISTSDPSKGQRSTRPRRSRQIMPRRPRAAIEDENEVVGPSARRQRSESAVDVSDAVSEEEMDVDVSYSSHNQMVKKLVRLALAHEVSRKPIRRQDVSDKVLGSAPRAFKRVFEDANEQLRNVFGMTMTELPQKEKVTTQQKRQAQRSGTQSQGASNNNKSYVVTTTLSSRFRRPAILPPIKTPSLELEAQYAGLYSWIITIIMLSTNKRISENKLDSYLTKMNADSNVAGDNTQKTLKRMERDGYIVRIKERDGGGEEIVDWMIGPRGKVEVGEAGVAGMVRTVYGVRANDLEDLEDKLDRSLGEGNYKRVTTKGGQEENGVEEGPGGGEAEAEAEHQTWTQRAPRRSSRRSRVEAEDDEEEEQEEEEGGEDEEESE